VVTLSLTPRGQGVVAGLAPKVMHYWNGLLSGFSHDEIDMLINLLTRLMIVADSKRGRKSRLLLSDVPIAKPLVHTMMARTAKARKVS